MVLAGVDFRECERLPHDTHFFHDMRREALRSAGRGERASIHFPVSLFYSYPLFSVFDNPFLGQCGREMSQHELHVNDYHNSYTSNIMAGVLEFIGSHLIIFSFICTIIIFSFQHSSLFFFFLFTPPFGGGHKTKTQNSNLYEHITVRVCR